MNCVCIKLVCQVMSFRMTVVLIFSTGWLIRFTLGCTVYSFEFCLPAVIFFRTGLSIDLIIYGQKHISRYYW